MVKNLFWGCLLLLLATAGSWAQTQPVKLVCWNLLNYPDPSNPASDTALRNPYYRTVVQHINPDILVTGENTSLNGTNWFLNQVMNASGNAYQKGVFINGPDSDNEIYFRSSLFSFLGNVAIETDLRDINEFTLVYMASGDTLRIYAVHLKASSGASNEAQRALEVDSLRKVTNRLAPGKNFIVCGDFNIYGSTEAAYVKLLQNNPNDDGNFLDPLFMPGTWDSSVYIPYHTQSTRTVSFGGGATGGLDDRFDMILYSTAIDQGTAGISFQAGSTTPVGNDGNHYNQSINTLPNTAVPVQVANALYNASDHLPVSVVLNFTTPTSVLSIPGNSGATLFPNPVNDHLTIVFPRPAGKVRIEVRNAPGIKIMERFYESRSNQMTLDVSAWLPGMYFLSVDTEHDCRVFRFLKK